MLEHVLNLGHQLKTDLQTSEEFTSFDNERILIVGMGGSGVAGDVLKLILNQHTNIDVEVRKAYNLTKTQKRPNKHIRQVQKRIRKVQKHMRYV